jgi:PAS domain S-box-containing protein
MFDNIVPGHVFFTVITVGLINSLILYYLAVCIHKIHRYILGINSSESSNITKLIKIALGDSTLPDVLIEQLPNAFLLINSNGVITRSNNKAKKIFETKSINGMNISSFIPKEYHNTHKDGMKEYLSSEPYDLGLRNVPMISGKKNTYNINMRFSVVGEGKDKRIIVLADKIGD